MGGLPSIHLFQLVFWIIDQYLPHCSLKNTIKRTVKITKINIPTIITADKAPVLPNSNVEAKALGISATIPEKIINEIPFPTP